MAFITPVNGDAQPVFALDTLNGPIAPSTSTAGSPVQPQGPKLEFFRFVAANTMAAQQGVNSFVANALQSIQQTTTIGMYQVDGVALSVAVYPIGAFANTTVALAAANVAGVAGTNQFSSCTNVGFKLST
tara:strand:- start:14 stop:403 length:390 start_codon:yes stop_codon:yes gene_type:complete